MEENEGEEKRGGEGQKGIYTAGMKLNTLKNTSVIRILVDQPE